MRRLLIGIAIVLLVAASAWSVWVAWPRPASSATEARATDLDEWEKLSQQYHRALPAGKDLVMIRLPGGINPRQITWSVTVNGTAP